MPTLWADYKTISNRSLRAENVEKIFLLERRGATMRCGGGVTLCQAANCTYNWRRLQPFYNADFTFSSHLLFAGCECVYGRWCLQLTWWSLAGRSYDCEYCWMRPTLKVRSLLLLLR